MKFIFNDCASIVDEINDVTYILKALQLPFGGKEPEITADQSMGIWLLLGACSDYLEKHAEKQ